MSKKAFVFFSCRYYSHRYGFHNLAFVVLASSTEEVVKMLEAEWVTTRLKGGYTIQVLKVPAKVLQKYNFYVGEDWDIFSIEQTPLLDKNLQ